MASPTVSRQPISNGLRNAFRREDPNQLVAIPSRQAPASFATKAEDRARRYTFVADSSTPRVQDASRAQLITDRDASQTDQRNRTREGARVVSASDYYRDRQLDWSDDGSSRGKVEQGTRVVAVNAYELAKSEKRPRGSDGTPGLLSPQLELHERRISDGQREALSEGSVLPSDVAEASLVHDAAMAQSSMTNLGNHEDAFPLPTELSNGGNELVATLALPGSLHSLPAECYLLIAPLGVATLALLARRNSPKQIVGPQAQSASPFPNLSLWPGSICLRRDSSGDSASSNHFAVTAGKIIAAVGLAVLAVGAVALLRGHLFGDAALRQPGLLIAAIGQGILLMGLVAQGVSRARHAVAPPHEALPNSAAASPIWPSVMPLLPLNAGYAWQIGMPMVASPQFLAATPMVGNAVNQSGQIAQIKAQLMSLSQQLDQLVTSSSPPPEAASKLGEQAS